jgi:hypothetical protein
VKHSILNGRAFSLCALQNTQISVLLCKLLRKRIGLIDASVLNDQHFRGKGLLFEEMEYLFQCARQAILLIMSGDDDR